MSTVVGPLSSVSSAEASLICTAASFAPKLRADLPRVAQGTGRTLVWSSSFAGSSLRRDRRVSSSLETVWVKKVSCFGR